MVTIDTSPLRSLSELEDVSDTTSSLGSGDWTDLSSAHADDVSDHASVDGSEAPAIARLNDGSEEAWTTAAMSSSSASLYASVHAPNPFDSDGESDKSVRPIAAPLGAFHDSHERLELGLVLPDPLERSESTVAADLLSFSDDVVLAANPTAVVSLAGAHPSIAQRTVVVTDVLVAIARATDSSVVRADYHNFTTLSGLPTRVQNTKAATKEISVLVRDHINDPLTHSLDGLPSILVVFTSDAQETNVPSINKHSILIPVVLSESRPVVLFDERDERMPDESSVDMDELIRQLSNLFTFERDSATSQTAVEIEPDKHLDSDVRTQDLELDAQSLDAFESDKEDILNETLVPIEEKPQLVARRRQPLDRLVGSERADVFRKFHANMGPGLTAACALAVFLSLVLGTNHLIQPKAADVNHGRYTTMANVPVMATSLSTVPPSSLAVKSPHTSLALKSTQTSLATKSPHTSLAVKSQHTSLSVRSSATSLATKPQHTSLSVRGPINESCSTAPASQATSTSLSTTLASTSLSTLAPSPSATTEPKKRVLDEVVEELGNTIDRIERAMGLNLRRDAEAALKAIRTEETIIEVVNRAKAVSDEAKEELHDRHQTARRNAQRQLASLKQGFESLVWGDEDVKGKGKEKDEAPEKKTKGKARPKETPRPGRGKWHTSKQKLCQRGKDNLKSSKPKDESKPKDNSQSKPKSKPKPKRKAPFPTREEQEKAQTAGRAKRPTQSHPDEASMWVWDEYEYEYPFGYGPRAVMEEVREYFF